MTQKFEADELLPDYMNWYLKSKGLSIEYIKKQAENKTSIDEPTEDFKKRELEQKQELLIGLTKELFNKIEKIEQIKSNTNQEKNQKPIKEAKNTKIVSEKESSKIEFSDLSWYRKKLEDSQK